MEKGKSVSEKVLWAVRLLLAKASARLMAFAWLQRAPQVFCAFQTPPLEMSSEQEAQLELEGKPFPPHQPAQGMEEKPEPASSPDFPHQISPPGWIIILSSRQFRGVVFIDRMRVLLLNNESCSQSPSMAISCVSPGWKILPGYRKVGMSWCCECFFLQSSIPNLVL